MYRGTTPQHIFESDLDLSEAATVYITYEQAGKTILEKSKNDITFSEGRMSVTLTQEETLKFDCRFVEIQIRARFADGRAVASNIITTTANKILKEGVI